MAEENKNTIEESEEVSEAVSAEEENAVEAAVPAADDSADNDEEAAKAEKKEGRIVDDILEIIESTLLTVFVVIMIFTYLLHPITVEGTSMNDTLFKDDRVFMSTVYFGPHYGDIIVINNDAAYLLDENGEAVKKDISNSSYKECLIKRVIAEPGQTIDIDPEKEEVLIDGKVIDEPYIKETINTLSFTAFDFPITIPEGYYFAMGDNRRVSADSRNPDIGLIKKDQIYGKAIIRYYPVKDFKFLKFKK
ncbi:MAG: signal peptidase I [Ruminococcus sp.]|uniref:signal peptidase I n=1 Tax=Ruminococcus sp. TaxID=41978 RepID=UPI0025E1BF6E|nr:signal peptidase I [Ruminococcus sp.]MBR5682211.1 signal peptidase I [Ruminococcus sp.]